MAGNIAARQRNLQGAALNAAPSEAPEVPPLPRVEGASYPWAVKVLACGWVLGGAAMGIAGVFTGLGEKMRAMQK